MRTGVDVGSARFNPMFQEEWIHACANMSMGKREERGVGLIAPGCFASFMKKYTKWATSEPARAHIRARARVHTRERASTRARARTRA